MIGMGYTLITGATSDIGRQICATLESAGHLLLLTDLDQEALSATMLSLEHPERHCALALDLSDVENAEKKMTDFILANRLSVTHAVFAAGIFTIKPVKLVNYSFVKKKFDVAVFSVFSLVECLAAKSVNADNLHGIVLLSSVSAKIGAKGYTTYGAVKGALLGMMRSLAVELAPRVRVNAILPGGIRTRTTSFIFENQETSPRYLLGEGEKTDVSNMVEFLLSDRARWITGQDFIVDGGLTSN